MRANRCRACQRASGRSGTRLPIALSPAPRYRNSTPEYARHSASQRIMSEAQLVFLDIDTQVDFMLPAGALYVPGAETIIPNLQRLMTFAAAQRLLVLSSADAHAPDDPSFAQWPPHCVAGTPGQQRIAETRMPAPLLLLNRPGAFRPPAPAAGQVILEKIDYDVSSNPNFDPLLRALGDSRFVVFGVATGYCVQASALALRRRGYAVIVVTDAIRGITEEGHQTALRTLAEAGVRFASTDDVLALSATG
ncbi:MAG: cysteine hydrolase [Acidobacteria bacterium]|nr:MAG: cysteine hydrolase [Acidobacteriota bacterium]